jgi:hypothetical protein
MVFCESVDAWAALGEIHLALQKIAIKAKEQGQNGLTPSELDALGEITDQIAGIEQMTEQLRVLLTTEVN